MLLVFNQSALADVGRLVGVAAATEATLGGVTPEGAAAARAVAAGGLRSLRNGSLVAAPPGRGQYAPVWAELPHRGDNSTADALFLVDALSCDGPAQPGADAVRAALASGCSSVASAFVPSSWPFVDDTFAPAAVVAGTAAGRIDAEAQVAVALVLRWDMILSRVVPKALQLLLGSCCTKQSWAWLVVVTAPSGEVAAFQVGHAVATFMPGEAEDAVDKGTESYGLPAELRHAPGWSLVVYPRRDGRRRAGAGGLGKGAPSST